MDQQPRTHPVVVPAPAHPAPPACWPATLPRACRQRAASRQCRRYLAAAATQLHCALLSAPSPLLLAPDAPLLAWGQQMGPSSHVPAVGCCRQGLALLVGGFVNMKALCVTFCAGQLLRLNRNSTERCWNSQCMSVAKTCTVRIDMCANGTEFANGKCRMSIGWWSCYAEPKNCLLSTNVVKASYTH
jgi:hypothetical protein